MPMLNERDTETVKKEFEKMKDSVVLKYFKEELNCPTCADTEKILTEVAGLSEKIKLEVYNMAMDRELAGKYGITQVPATVIQGREDYGVRYYGIPAGIEFTTLIHAMLVVSGGPEGIPAEIKAEADRITKDVSYKVFVTPTCPYCPRAALSAVYLAVASKNVNADVIEVGEFPEMGRKYNVSGVPKTVVNEVHDFVGAHPIKTFIDTAISATEGATAEKELIIH
jgi:glutaredoxin-like protein